MDRLGSSNLIINDPNSAIYKDNNIFIIHIKRRKQMTNSNEYIYYNGINREILTVNLTNKGRHSGIPVEEHGDWFAYTPQNKGEQFFIVGGFKTEELAIEKLKNGFAGLEEN